MIQVSQRGINAKKRVNFRTKIGERRTGRGQRADLGKGQAVTARRVGSERDLGVGHIGCLHLEEGCVPPAQIKGREKKLGRCLKQKDKVRGSISQSGKVVFEKISWDF